ncbi:MAG: complex intermediate-associated 30 family protein, partial [Deltaproteobacteria bacterium]|nr:complex intermediate-associated 30 family protein [Deltaproteobacteria bacterium]
MAQHLFDFQTAESTADWSAIDDAVMGGISASRLRHDPAGHALFEGVVSL